MQSLVKKTENKVQVHKKEAQCCAKISNNAVGCHD